MNKLKIILGLSIWVIILPFLGFTNTLKDIIYSTTGLIFVYFSYTLYKNLKMEDVKKEVFENFSENSDFKENNTKLKEESNLSK